MPNPIESFSPITEGLNFHFTRMDGKNEFFMDIFCYNDLIAEVGINGFRILYPKKYKIIAAPQGAILILKKN